jgi:hypothetical protein
MVSDPDCSLASANISARASGKRRDRGYSCSNCVRWRRDRCTGTEARNAGISCALAIVLTSSSIVSTQCFNGGIHTEALGSVLTERGLFARRSKRVQPSTSSGLAEIEGALTVAGTFCICIAA